MRTSLLSLLVTTLLLPALHADVEMVQEVKNQTAGTNTDLKMTMRLKGNMARVDVGDQTSVLINSDTGDMTTLLHGQKMSTQISGAQMEAMMKQLKPNPASDAAIKLEPTGAKEKINGYDCEEYVSKSSMGEVHFWIAKSYPNYKERMKSLYALQTGKLSKFAQANPYSNLKPEDFPGMPIRTVMDMGTGGKVSSTLVSMEEKPLDAGLFKAPADYKSLALPNLGGAEPAAAIPKER